MKLNSYMAILLALALMLGEIIRSWGQHRNFLFIVDDFIFGGLLFAGAISTLQKHFLGKPLLIAGWASCFALTYGSFFSKIVHANANFESNFNQNFLTFLIGFAMILSIIGLFFSIKLNK